MFIDPSMGGRIYNPWLAQSNILQRFQESNPSKTMGQQPNQSATGSTNYRFYGMGQKQTHSGVQEHTVFRSFFQRGYMNRIRLASPEEVETIKDKSDLTTGDVVFALDTQKGVGLAVRRLCTEIDPMVPGAEWDTKLRAMFTRDLETVLFSQGGTHYYFNVDAEDEEWQHVVKTWGAEQVSTKPVLRFKRTLQETHLSTTNQTKTSASFDPNSMGVFQGLTSTYGSAIQDEIQNPYSNMFFNTQLAMGNQGQQASSSAGNSALLQRAQAMGINPSSPLFMQMMAQQQRGNQSNQSNMFNNLLLQAAQLRQGAIGQAGSYRPLQTGQTSTQKQSGVGSWLPQIAGAAIKGGMAAATGGASAGFDFGGAGAGPSGGMNPGFSLGTPGIPDPFGGGPGGGTPDYNPFLH